MRLFARRLFALTGSCLFVLFSVSTPAQEPPYAPRNDAADVATADDAAPAYLAVVDGRASIERDGSTEALEHSRNVPTVRLMSTLGAATVIEYAKRLGVASPVPPYLSSAIGAGEATLLEMTSAYSAFPNQGVRMAPVFLTELTDRDGNVLEQHRPEPREAIRADTAFIMTTLLEGVIKSGTAATDATEPLRGVHWPIGGKTGTTDDYTDAWFVGFDPDITIGVWVGFDQKRPIGGNATGGVAALPIWTEIMKSWVERRRREVAEPPAFARPGNVVFVGGEAYIAGTEPGGK